MKQKLLVTGILLALTAACDNTAQELSNHYDTCLQQRGYGNMISAEKFCTLALGEDLDIVLDDEVLFQRLYQLGSVKRQMSKFDEAKPYLKRSLGYADKLPAGDPGAGLVHYELALVASGDKRWVDAARSLQSAIALSDTYNDQEVRALAKAAGYIVRQLEATGESDLATQLKTGIESVSPDG